MQAAINAARADLPTSLRSNPTYRKVNPADAPILILALTSKTLTRGQIYDAASNVLAAAAVAGRRHRPGDRRRRGAAGGARGAQSAGAVQIRHRARGRARGAGLRQCQQPEGVDRRADDKHYQIYTNDQALKAADYKPLIIAYRNGAPVRLSDMAEVTDGVENIRNAGLSNGQPAVLVILFRQPGANIIDTVDRGEGGAAATGGGDAAPTSTCTIANDRTPTIRASLHDIERTLLIAVALVMLVVFVFLRNCRARR